MKTMILKELKQTSKQLDNEIKKILSLAIREPSSLIGRGGTLESKIVELTCTSKVMEILVFSEPLEEIDKNIAKTLKVERYNTLITLMLKSLVSERWRSS